MKPAGHRLEELRLKKKKDYGTDYINDDKSEKKQRCYLQPYGGAQFKPKKPAFKG